MLASSLVIFDHFRLWNYEAKTCLFFWNSTYSSWILIYIYIYVYKYIYIYIKTHIQIINFLLPLLVVFPLLLVPFTPPLLSQPQHCSFDLYLLLFVQSTLPNWAVTKTLALVICCIEGIKKTQLPSLKLTWHLKMDGWNTSFLLGWPIFRGELLVLGSVYGDCNKLL